MNHKPSLRARTATEAPTTGTIKSFDVNQNYDYRHVVKDICPKCSDIYFDCYDQSNEPVCPTTITRITYEMPKTKQAGKPRCIESNIFYTGKPFNTKWSTNSEAQCNAGIFVLKVKYGMPLFGTALSSRKRD